MSQDCQELIAIRKLKNTAERYGIVSQAFHWLIVVLIIVQYQMGRIAEDLPLGFDKLVLMSRHKSLGMTILGLALLRLLWRLANKSPGSPPGLHRALQGLGRTTHVALYGLLLALPITGWLASSYANSPVSWWGWFTVPDLVMPDKENFERLSELHQLLTRFLIVVVTLHAAAALVHHFYFKDDVLRRMLPGWPGLRK
ncbi:MAG: cytochrome b [Gammaproteobacteria bacterium]|nr:cytochrome b [Gammaproteobacteria bacterium]